MKDVQMDKWISKAEKIGFSTVVVLDTKTLRPMQEVRDMCKSGRCQAYGKNWTCPPACGTLEACALELTKYNQGLLLQTVGQMQKMIDTKAYIQTEEKHLQMFRELAEKIREKYPDALCLGSGGCRVCESCAYPDACRFPKKAYSSMEGSGLFVSQVCKDNGIKYYYGEKTIAYTACILF